MKPKHTSKYLRFSLPQKRLAKTQIHSCSSPPSLSTTGSKSLMKFYNHLSRSDLVLALNLPMLTCFHTAFKALIPFLLHLPFFNGLYALAAFLSPKLTFFFQLHGLSKGDNLNLSQTYCWGCNQLDIVLIVVRAITLFHRSVLSTN